MPKTFLAVNLSDAFSFQEKQNTEGPHGESEETTQDGEDVLEMKGLGRGGATETSAEAGSGGPQTERVEAAGEETAQETAQQ